MPATGFSFSGSTLEESDLRESRRPDIGSAASRRDAHASAAESSGCRFLLAHRTDIGAAGAIIIVFAIFGALNPNFLTARNLSGIITVSAEIGLLSLGVGLVIIEIDIPIAAVFTVAGIIMGQLLTWGWSDIVALGVVLLFGLVGGAQFDRTEQDRGIRYCLQRIATKRQAQSEALTADLSWPIRDQHAWLADLALRTGQMSPQGVIISGAE